MSSPGGKRPAWKRSRLWPPNWPIRAKLTAVSAGLTFVILVLFGFGVGQLATTELRENFADETTNDAGTLVEEIVRQGGLTPSTTPVGLIGLLDRRPDSAEVILLANGTVLRHPQATALGPPGGTGLSTYGGYQVATVKYPLASNELPGLEGAIALVRVGRSLESLERRQNTVWFSIGAGILGASLLAGLASAILAGRALRPLTRLTGAAGEIARTRDPGVTLPEPDGEDEVVELTRSFNDMLHELSAARSEREAALNRQREFVADASHELRTPLTSVLANLELLDDSPSLPSGGPERESVESALRSSLRMRRLVADLQILARADTGKDSPREECDLASIAESAAGEIRPIAGSHHIATRNGSPVPVEGVLDDLHRAVLNLVENAVNHTPPGTEIEVVSGSDQATGMAFVEVSDEGGGVPDELKARIFDRFVREQGSADRTSGESTGLGLSIVRAIARQHGGRASVEDRPGGGSVFRIELPLATHGSHPPGV